MAFQEVLKVGVSCYPGIIVHPRWVFPQVASDFRMAIEEAVKGRNFSLGSVIVAALPGSSVLIAVAISILRGRSGRLVVVLSCGFRHVVAIGLRCRLLGRGYRTVVVVRL